MLTLGVPSAYFSSSQIACGSSQYVKLVTMRMVNAHFNMAITICFKQQDLQ
jgi:hypothetical protein